MDIPALATAMSMEKLQMNVGIAVMAKVMDTMETSNAAMAELLDSVEAAAASSGIPGLGENIDILV